MPTKPVKSEFPLEISGLHSLYVGGMLAHSLYMWVICSLEAWFLVKKGIFLIYLNRI